ncbi:hypothetical protein PFISCL1PPCAC_9242, partial [Pristionchus fissidentatus]
AAAAAGCDENMPPSDGGRPADFSYTPISADGDPHSKDWSMDVISLLLKTYAYEDGAMVGPMNVKEGIIMRSDGSVEDICSSILQVDASLRARYHMTTTLAGARRFGPHAAAARNAQTDSVAAEIASAIDDFLGNYVPDDSNGGMQPQPLLQHMQHQQQYQQHGHDGMPHPHHPHYHHSQQLQLQPLQPFFSSPYNYENDCQLEESYGGCSENEPPTVAAAAAAAAGYYVPGGHQEGAGPKVAPMRYGVSNNQRPQLQQHYGGRQLQQLQQDQKPRPLQPRSAHEMDNKTGFHLSGGLPTSQPFVPARQRDGLSSAPPLADSSHSPFPPPAHLVARSETAAPARRPFGRLRCGAAAPHANNWTDGASAPGKTSPVSAHHPYHQSGSHHHHNHVPRHRAGARSSILKPRN